MLTSRSSALYRTAKEVPRRRRWQTPIRSSSNRTSRPTLHPVDAEGIFIDLHAEPRLDEHRREAGLATARSGRPPLGRVDRGGECRHTALVFTFVPFATQIGIQFWFLEGLLHGAMTMKLQQWQ
jgi:hypothetical protein